jgi:aspartate oxidase
VRNGTWQIFFVEVQGFLSQRQLGWGPERVALRLTWTISEEGDGTMLRFTHQATASPQPVILAAGGLSRVVKASTRDSKSNMKGVLDGNE